MSHPVDPQSPEAAGSQSGPTRELRRRGRVFGFDYDAGVLITTLADAEIDIPSAPHLLRAQRVELPVVEQRPREPTPDAVGDWESEGGAVA